MIEFLLALDLATKTLIIESLKKIADPADQLSGTTIILPDNSKLHLGMQVDISAKPQREKPLKIHMSISYNGLEWSFPSTELSVLEAKIINNI